MRALGLIPDVRAAAAHQETGATILGQETTYACRHDAIVTSLVD
jgi:hypothetical protein